MSEIELKPCRKCGSTHVGADQFAKERNRFVVECFECDYMTETCDTEDQARAIWNTRSQSERVSRLEEERDSALVRLYHHDPMEVARLCDEEFDRSGALLGRIRKRARSALNQGADDGR